MARNMFKSNTQLAMYLHSINGFYFPHYPLVTASASSVTALLKGKERAVVSTNKDDPSSPRLQVWVFSKVPTLQHSTQLEMPIHYAVAGVSLECDPKLSTQQKFHPGDWVCIKGDYNNQDIALVVTPDLWLDYHSTHIPLLLLPRLARSQADAVRYAANNNLHPPPLPFFFNEAVGLAEEMNFKVKMLNCYNNTCSKPYLCGHLQGFLYNDMLFHGGLMASEQKAQCISAAPSTVDPNIFEYFAQSQHPAI
ncbi:hypothetical protein GYMLUDRAFT_251826 [Collybiopsis luxurians FD-317 M1]|uniref:Uncharacterized protein n=1 Tax=Collybiopsis luxurians FD-317 M1 TaxID=944289 RepID=A0A0D0BPZ9_9AGAR|nr:hypothetical protein GYMLUDRAFT_251826 [Collybiopsis luxurians FD-317 M1]